MRPINMPEDMQSRAVSERPQESQEDRWWRAVEERDHSFGGRFVLAVLTTGIYCRPGCPARLPKRENTRFYADPETAAADGFRPCKRCKPRATDVPDDLALVIAACHMVTASLEAEDPCDVAKLCGWLDASDASLRRAFKRYLGIGPSQYIEARRFDKLRGALPRSRSVTDAVYAAGFEGPRRVYERAEAELGMTPGRFKNNGKGERIAYAIVASPLGLLLVAETAKGLCRVALGDREAELLDVLRSQFAGAELIAGDSALARHVGQILAYLEGRQMVLHLPLDLQATAFEALVWRSLQEIPPGELDNYGALAARIGMPKAARAVGRACGANPVALVVPCHRVVASDGKLTGYRWGAGRKRALIDMEAEMAGGPEEGDRHGAER